MPTLILVDGFEASIAWNTNSTTGGGLAGTVANAAAFTHDTGTKRSGSYSLKMIQDGVNATRIAKVLAAGVRTSVGSLYFYAAAAPATQSIVIDASAGPRPTFRLETDGKMNALYNGGTAQATAASVCDSTWHRLDWYANTVTTNAWTLDWQIDGVAQTQATRALTAADIVSFQIGSSGTTHNATIFFDDLVMSATAGDYPIGEHTVFAIKPTGDGTHAAGTNTIEDNAGTDIVSPNAFPLIDNWPPDTAAYIRQATVSTTSYAEVTFANHDATMTTIWDASAVVAYTSSTNAANEGGTVVSTDGFSTEVEVYGTGAARTNYQTAATTTLGYKCSNTSNANTVLTRPGGGWTTSLLDAITARVGYSNDVTGNPRWHGLIVQYAGTLGVGGGSTTESVGFIPI